VTISVILFIKGGDFNVDFARDRINTTLLNSFYDHLGGMGLNPIIYHSACNMDHMQARSAKHSVIRTTTLSYGNMRFSGTCPAETPQLMKMKFCTIDNVGKVTRWAKIVGISWLEAAPQIGEI
jgi:hypothetical protein